MQRRSDRSATGLPSSASCRSPSTTTRRQFLAFCGWAGLTACRNNPAGTGETQGVHIWGGQGFRDGQFLRPRAIACREGVVYVIDTTGRIQVFDEAGTFLRGWRTPDAENGTPTALAFAGDGRVLVPDTHNHRILEYTPEGELLAQWGEFGSGPNHFVYPTGIAQADDGRYFVTEYGEDAERVHVFDKNRAYLTDWGGHGAEPGQFNRAMAVALADNRLFVADTTNHRIQEFSLSGELMNVFGEIGSQPGRFRFPFDISAHSDGSLLVAEYGNNRISRFSLQGEYTGAIGTAGSGPGEFNAPRGVAGSHSGYVFVADTDNHRIQRIPAEPLG